MSSLSGTAPVVDRGDGTVAAEQDLVDRGPTCLVFPLSMPLPRTAPSSLMVQILSMWPGNRDAVSAITSGTTGRNPASAQMC